MQHYRCKCGEATAFGSTPPIDCQGCAKCNTTYAQSPDGHLEPKPHEWIKKYNQNTGEPYEVCERCLTKNKN